MIDYLAEGCHWSYPNEQASDQISLHYIARSTPLDRWRCGGASGSVKWRFWSGNSINFLGQSMLFHSLLSFTLNTFQTELLNQSGNWSTISFQKISPSFSKHFVVKLDDHVSFACQVTQVKFWKCVGIYCVKKGSCLRVFDITLRQKWIKWPVVS